MENETYDDAQAANGLRVMITAYAKAAVDHGKVDRGWVNTQLSRMGAELVTGVSQYKINAPITGSYGTTVTAATRTEALAKFNEYAANVAANGAVRTGSYGQGVFNVEFTPDAGEPEFFSGPEDVEPSTEPVPGLEALKVAIRQMLKDAVAEQGWGINYAQGALSEMGLEPLPALTVKTVQVPVSGTASLNVQVFDGDDDAAVQRAAASTMARAGHVYIQPEEIGWAAIPRPDSGSGVKVVDEDDEDDRF